MKILCSQWSVYMRYITCYQFNACMTSMDFPSRSMWLTQTIGSHTPTKHQRLMKALLPPRIWILALHILGFLKWHLLCTLKLNHGSLGSHWDLVISWTPIGLYNKSMGMLNLRIKLVSGTHVNPSLYFVSILLLDAYAL